MAITPPKPLGKKKAQKQKGHFGFKLDQATPLYWYNPNNGEILNLPVAVSPMNPYESNVEITPENIDQLISYTTSMTHSLQEIKETLQGNLHTSVVKHLVRQGIKSVPNLRPKRKSYPDYT